MQDANNGMNPQSIVAADPRHPGQPLIVGAGPVGLAAALFLARRGMVPRIIEMLDQPSPQSRALAVNPRTLDILEPTGLTERMLELGLPIHGVRFYRQGRCLATLSFAGIHPKYPFMLALSQATTERLLAGALEAAGGAIERGVKMVECRTLADQVEVTLEPLASGSREIIRCPWLVAADGAHSVGRHQLGIDFAGSSLVKNWHLADTPLRTSLAPDHAHVFFLKGGGFLFMIRVVDETQKDRSGDPVWRVMVNHPDPLSCLVQAEQAGPPLWTSNFQVSHRIGTSLAFGHVYLAGDAAHIHSPVGARGMNLGLEDAWVFSELARVNRLQEYDRLRRPVDRQVVRQVEFFSKVVSADSLIPRLMRRFLFPTMIGSPLIRHRLAATITGLDHELPRIDADGAN